MALDVRELKTQVSFKLKTDEKVRDHPNVLAVVSILAGISLWFPSFSLHTIGNQNGLQLAPVLFLILLIVNCMSNKSRLSVTPRVASIIWAWLICLLLSTLFSTNIIVSVKGILEYASGLLVLFVAASTPLLLKPTVIPRLIRGFLIGGIISSVYACYQVLGGMFGWPYRGLLNNNPSFPSPVSTGELEIYSRGFGFTPEPSVLSSLLVPALFILLGKVILHNQWKHKASMLILFVGLLSCSSLSLFSLPIIFILIAILSIKKFRSKILIISLITLVLITFVGLLLYMIDGSLLQGFLKQNLNRLMNLNIDPSFQVRFTAAISAIQIFMSNLFSGYGVMATAPAFEGHSVALHYIQNAFIGNGIKAGVDSWPLAILSEQGLLGIFSFLSTFILAIYTSRKSLPIFAGLISLFIIIDLQTGYRLLYHVWALLGIGLAIRTETVDEK